MRIDDDIEAKMREAIGSFVVRNRDRFVAAIHDLPDDKDGRGLLVIATTLMINVAVLRRTLGGQLPTPAQVDLLTEEFARTETPWSGIEPGQVHDILMSMVDGGSNLTYSLADAGTIALATAGWLLASYKPKELTWEQYLDEIEDGLEAAD